MSIYIINPRVFVTTYTTNPQGPHQTHTRKRRPSRSRQDKWPPAFLDGLPRCGCKFKQPRSAIRNAEWASPTCTNHHHVAAREAFASTAQHAMNMQEPRALSFFLSASSAVAILCWTCQTKAAAAQQPSRGCPAAPSEGFITTAGAHCGTWPSHQPIPDCC